MLWAATHQDAVIAMLQKAGYVIANPVVTTTDAEKKTILNAAGPKVGKAKRRGRAAMIAIAALPLSALLAELARMIS